jgi:ATP-dependent protease ClpP protease subunit
LSVVVWIKIEEEKQMAGDSKVTGKDVFMERRVIIVGEINDTSVLDIVSGMLTLQAQSTDRINLLIDSPGGQDGPARKLCDFMASLITAPIRGIAMGSCHSAATFVMLHCDERVSTPNSRFVIHSGKRSGISLQLNHTTQKELEDLLAESKADTEWMIRMYMKKLGKSRKVVEALIRRGDQRFNDSISATEALEIGMIQKIVEGKLDIFPKAAP